MKLGFLKSLKRKDYIFLLLSVVLIGTFLFASPAQATIAEAVATVVGWIVYGIVYILGLILMLIMWILIKVAQFNDFITADPVIYGWVIVRDLCNMFFILILLIIAFATILRIEQYSFKRLLPKLILMAVLINFSKLICGIIIDFAQVIMLTFVNGFKDIGGGNLTNMLGIEAMMEIDGKNTSEDSAVDAWSILGSYMLALLYTIIALICLVALLAVLVMRMIMLWVYIVLSPLAYLLATFPQGQKYASMWWEKFSKEVIIGPILAFFIWLSFASLGGVEDPRVISNIQNLGKAESGVEGEFGTQADPSAGITKAGSPDHMIKFIISIAMLIGGMQISQELGGQGGAMARMGMQKLQKLGAGTVGAGKRVMVGAARKTGAAAASAGKFVGGTVDRFAGKGIDKLTKGRTSLGEKGIATSAVMGVRNLPGNLRARFESTFNRNKELNQERRDAVTSGEIKRGDTKYMQEKDAKGNIIDNKFAATTKDGKFVSTLNWQDLSKNSKNAGDYTISDGTLDKNGNLKKYKYDSKKDTFLDDEGKALQHNGKALNNANFHDFMENNKAAKLNYNNEQFSYNKDEGKILGGANGKTALAEAMKQAGDTKASKAAEQKVYLTDKKGKEVKGMGAFGQAWRDAHKVAYSAPRAAANKAQEERVEKEKAKLEGLSTEELSKELSSAYTSRDRKVAAAMTLAVKAGFKDKQQIGRAKELIGNNPAMMKKFNDEVDSKQAHLNYNLADTNDRTKFKRRIEEGKIDSTNLKNYGPEVLSVLEEYHGPDFGRVITAAYGKNKKSEELVSQGLLQRRKIDDDGKINKDDTSAALHAKLTGDFKNSFEISVKDSSGNVSKAFDASAFASFLKSKNATASNLNKFKAKDMDDATHGNSIKQAIFANLDYAKLKSMVKQGDNPELVAKIRDMIVDNYNNNVDHKDIKSILSDKELMSIGQSVVTRRAPANQNNPNNQSNLTP